MILMLDFDGVLHPDPCPGGDLLFCRLPVLEEVLREFPAVEIVITSTWRQTRSLSELKEFFSPDIAQRIIGATPNWQDHAELAEQIGPSYIRSVEIEAWLRIRGQPWLQWLALDDKRHWFRPFCENLVLSDPATGLTASTALELRRRFTMEKI